MGRALSEVSYGSYLTGTLRKCRHSSTHLTNSNGVGSKLVTLSSLGYRTEAVSILGREVMLPRGLIGLGFDSIDLCGPEIAEVDFPISSLCHLADHPVSSSIYLPG
jgi:hypothetical protein